MPQPLRLATNEEVESIRSSADLESGCTVLALDKDLVVLRACHELDPFFIAPDTTDRQKAMFIWAVENCLRFTGVPFYYFNVAASDEKWIKNVESWGAQRTSTEPEYRYKKLLVDKVA